MGARAARAALCAGLEDTRDTCVRRIFLHAKILHRKCPDGGARDRSPAELSLEIISRTKDAALRGVGGGVGGSIAAGREEGGGAVGISFLEHAWLRCASGAGPAAPMGDVLHEASEVVRVCRLPFGGAILNLGTLARLLSRASRRLHFFYLLSFSLSPLHRRVYLVYRVSRVTFAGRENN